MFEIENWCSQSDLFIDQFVCCSHFFQLMDTDNIFRKTGKERNIFIVIFDFHFLTNIQTIISTWDDYLVLLIT